MMNNLLIKYGGLNRITSFYYDIPRVIFCINFDPREIC